MIFQWSCCWKKSCTTWDVKNPANNGINYQPQVVIARFLPSRVSVPVIPRISPPKMMIWRESSWSWEKNQFQFGETFLKGQFCQEFILLRVILPPERILGGLQKIWRNRTEGRAVHILRTRTLELLVRLVSRSTSEIRRRWGFQKLDKWWGKCSWYYLMLVVFLLYLNVFPMQFQCQH